MQRFDTQYRRLEADADADGWSPIGMLTAQRLRAVDCGLQSARISSVKVDSTEGDGHAVVVNVKLALPLDVFRALIPSL